ncbi:MAG: type II toxin-antitoxin system RatA family toxin [Gammaproteobacteria bacterium]|nr:type II toxin-antitoxin system RatA family toxin [Gammaproteobacteria bacterium]
MSEVERSALVNFSAQQMYDLVNDVGCYAEFLPGCTAARVLEQSDKMMFAILELKKGPIKQTFSTKNTLVEGQSIKMELQDGPFKYLHGHWFFRELAKDACKVELDLSFEFNSRLTSAAFGRMFIDLTSRLVDSFVKRAQVVYEK